MAGAPNLTALHDLATGVLGCVCASLDQAAADLPGHPGCPCRACVVPGGAVADDCCADPGPAADGCAGGTLYVSVGPVYPTDPFPTPVAASRWAQCTVNTLDVAVDLTVSLFRCTPTLDGVGNAPSCDLLEAAARRHHVDGWAMYRGVLCCLGGLPTRRRGGPRYTIGPLLPVAPGSAGVGGGAGGGCQAWTQKVTVALEDRCRCPGTESS